MASIYKRKRDRKKKHAPYWIQYVDHEGRRQTVKGCSDKELTEKRAAELEREVWKRTQGLIDPQDDKFAKERKRPLAEHLDDYENQLAKRTEKHKKLTMARIRRIVEDGGMETVTDIDIETVEEVLQEVIDTDDIGLRTYNHYVDAVFGFCGWMVNKARRLPANPLVGIDRKNAEEDIRHPRRALLPDEFTSLVDSARTSGVEIQCFDGEQRARIYILSYMTGLRRKELGSLIPRSFALEAKPATLTVEAACSKHRRKDILPVHAELIPLLREWLKGIQPDQPLFPMLAKRRTWLMVKKDLERAGIPYKDEQGRIADFHAAGRHTHITELLRNGASLPEARELARHSDVRMTMKYTHIGIDDQAKALANLPADGKWLHIGCNRRGVDGHEAAQVDTETGDCRSPKPRRRQALGTNRHVVSQGDADDPDHRTRVRFPPPPLSRPPC